MPTFVDVATGQRYVDRRDICAEDGHLYDCHPVFYERDGKPGAVHPIDVYCKNRLCPMKVPE
jgi:hypothetical protein